jgi:hypothetical protein
MVAATGTKLSKANTMKIKSFAKQWMTALAAACGLALAASAQDIYYCQNMDPTFPAPAVVYQYWSAGGATFTPDYNGVGGLEVHYEAAGQPAGHTFGSFYYGQNSGFRFSPNGNDALTSGDTQCTFTFTVNPTLGMAASGPLFHTNYNWIGTVFYLNLDSGIYDLIPPNNYSGWNNPGNPANVVWNGSNVTWTFNMASAVDISGHTNFVAYTDGGTNHFYGFNFGIDPAVIFNSPNPGTNTPGNFDITINSIEFAPAPMRPPNLTIQQVGTNVVVSWPNTGTFTLQQSANMARFSWSPWGFPPILNNDTNTVTILPPFNTPLFFRLSNP